ncbi:MAG: RNB domain-containing ribonuclease [Cyanobium sp.]
MPQPGPRHAAPAAPHPGDLVGLVDDRGPQLAVVQEIRGSRANLRVGPTARPLALPLRQLDLIACGDRFAAPAPGPAQPPWGLQAPALAAALPPARERSAAWLLLQSSPAADGSPSAISLEELADLLGSASDPALRAALWLWLHGQQTLFRWRQAQVSPRAPEELRRLRLQQRRERLLATRREAWHQQLRQRRPIESGSLTGAEAEELALLRRWARGDSDTPLPSPLRQALQQTHCAAEPGPIRHLLADLGQWPRHHLPSLEATTWEHGFSAELEAEAQRLLALVPTDCAGDEHRRDLCHLHLFTIDDDDTVDIDDGLSLELDPAGGPPRIWIHIADPGRLIVADSPLDLEARRRGSSLYLARGPLPMFPEALVAEAFSLRQGARCPAWSLAVGLDQSGAVQSYELLRSWVKPAYRLSYADADELIELAPPEEPAPALIHALMRQRRAWRLQRGALEIEQPEGRIRCRQDQAELEVIEPSASRSMVAEAMILAGAVIAAHGIAGSLALPYRSQQSANLPSEQELAELAPGPVRHAALRRCLSRGHVGIQPALHFSLGLEAYVQATSPIRRYGDLLTQRQLALQLEGGPVLDEARMAGLLSGLEGAVREGITISREDQRHWQQVWFEQNPRPNWRGLMLRWLRPQDDLALVQLEELCLDFPCLCPASARPGDPLLVHVELVDSLRDQLRLRASG